MNQYFSPEFSDLDGFKKQIELLINIKTHFKNDIIEKTLDLEEIQKELQSTAYNNHLTLTIEIKQNPNEK